MPGGDSYRPNYAPEEGSIRRRASRERFTSDGIPTGPRRLERRESLMSTKAAQTTESESATPVDSPRSPLVGNDDRTARTVDPRRSRLNRSNPHHPVNFDGAMDVEPIPKSSEGVTMMSLLTHITRRAILEDRLESAQGHLNRVQHEENDLKQKYPDHLSLLGRSQAERENAEKRFKSVQSELQRHTQQESAMMNRLSLPQRDLLQSIIPDGIPATVASPSTEQISNLEVQVASLNRTIQTQEKVFAEMMSTKVTKSDLETRISQFSGQEADISKWQKQITSVDERMTQLQQDFSLHKETLNGHRTLLNGLKQKEETSEQALGTKLNSLKQAIQEQTETKLNTLASAINRSQAEIDARVSITDAKVKTFDGLNLTLNRLTQDHNNFKTTCSDKLSTIENMVTIMSKDARSPPSKPDLTPATTNLPVVPPNAGQSTRDEFMKFKQSTDQSIKNMNSRLNAITTSELYKAIMDTVQPLGPLCDQVRADHSVLISQIGGLQRAIVEVQKQNLSRDTDRAKHDEQTRKVEASLENLQKRLDADTAQPLRTAIDDLQSQINKLQQNMQEKAEQARIEQLQQNISFIEGRIAELDEVDATHATAITEVNEALDTVKADITKLENQTQSFRNEVAIREPEEAADVSTKLLNLQTTVQSNQNVLDSLIGRVGIVEKAKVAGYDSPDPGSNQAAIQKNVERVEATVKKLATIMRSIAEQQIPRRSGFVRIENVASTINETWLRSKFELVIPQTIWFRGGRLEGGRTNRHALVQLDANEIDGIVAKLQGSRWKGRNIVIYKIDSEPYLDILFEGVLPPQAAPLRCETEDADTIMPRRPDMDQKPIVEMSDIPDLNQHGGQGASISSSHSPGGLVIRTEDASSRRSTPSGSTSGVGERNGKRRMISGEADTPAKRIRGVK